MSVASGELRGMDDDTRWWLLRAVGEDQPGRGRVRHWTVLEAVERAGLVVSHTRRGCRSCANGVRRWCGGDVDAGTGEKLWWLLASGRDELDRLEAGERR